MLKDTEGIPIESQNLIYGNAPLRDNSTILDYQIKKDCTLTLIGRIKGGNSGLGLLPVSFNKMEKPFLIQFKDTAPDWRIV